MNNEIIYINKYKKYKHKYLYLKYNLDNSIGGNIIYNSGYDIFSTFFSNYLNDSVTNITKSYVDDLISFCNNFIFIKDIIKFFYCIICSYYNNTINSIITNIITNLTTISDKDINLKSYLINHILELFSSLPCIENLKNIKSQINKIDYYLF
jgi:hypothetical protein